jgi:hypothetical protein
MKKRLLALAIIPIVLLIAGCTAPLTSKLVSTSLLVTAPQDTLIGDPVKVSASTVLKGGRTDKVTLKIQLSTGGTDWTTVKKSTGAGPKLSAAFSYRTKSASTVKYRAIVTSTATSSKPVDSSAITSLKTSDIKQLIRTYYYNTTHAFDKGSAAGIAYEAAEDSPVYDLTAPTLVANDAADVAAGEIDTMVPDLSTISPDPTWILSGASSCNAAMTAPPAGRTFIVTVAEGETYSSTYLPFEANEDVHVTLVHGKLVDYIELCGS